MSGEAPAGVFGEGGAVAAAAAALLLVACGPPAVPLPPVGEPTGPTLSDQLGISLALPWGASPAAAKERRARLSRLTATGIHRARTDFLWHRIEKTPGQFDFTELDPL